MSRPVGVAVIDRAELFAHAPVHDHCLGHVGGLHDVGTCSAGDVVEDKLFGNAAAKAYLHKRHAIVARKMGAVFFGQRERRSAHRPAGNNAHFMQRVGVFGQRLHQRMAGLMIGRQFFILFIDHDGCVLRGPSEPCRVPLRGRLFRQNPCWPLWRAIAASLMMAASSAPLNIGVCRATRSRSTLRRRA